MPTRASRLMAIGALGIQLALGSTRMVTIKQRSACALSARIILMSTLFMEPMKRAGSSSIVVTNHSLLLRNVADGKITHLSDIG